MRFLQLIFTLSYNTANKRKIVFKFSKVLGSTLFLTKFDCIKKMYQSNYDVYLFTLLLQSVNFCSMCIGRLGVVISDIIIIFFFLKKKIILRIL